jgi:hypothetical protein
VRILEFENIRLVRKVVVRTIHASTRLDLVERELRNDYGTSADYSCRCGNEAYARLLTHCITSPVLALSPTR